MLLSQPLHLPFKPSPTRYTTTGIHFRIPTARKFSWPGIPGRNLRVSPLVSSSAPQLPHHDETGSAEDFKVELGRLLALLPEEMRRRVSEHPELRDLIEVVMDLGRKPLARFPSGDFVLSDHPITMEDILHATSQVGDFAVDNRAGISRTLHRISGIRNRKGAIIGLTCRVGRAVSGSANLLRDLVKDGASLLLIGPPGVGKTTIIRDIARMLANEYKMRVMIVDTSNEIGGDGDIPHSGIGNARRMQVPHTDVQHKMEKMMEEMQSVIAAVATRISDMEGSLSALDQALGRHDAQFATILTKLEAMNSSDRHPKPYIEKSTQMATSHRRAMIMDGVARMEEGGPGDSSHAWIFRCLMVQTQ